MKKNATELLSYSLTSFKPVRDCHICGWLLCKCWQNERNWKLHYHFSTSSQITKRLLRLLLLLRTCDLQWIPIDFSVIGKLYSMLALKKASMKRKQLKLAFLHFVQPPSDCHVCGWLLCNNKHSDFWKMYCIHDVIQYCIVK